VFPGGTPIAPPTSPSIATPSLSSSSHGGTAEVAEESSVDDPQDDPPTRVFAISESVRTPALEHGVPHVAIERPRISLDAEESVTEGSSATLARASRSGGKAFLIVLLMLALGLFGASMALQGNPDPRPLVQELLERWTR